MRKVLLSFLTFMIISTAFVGGGFLMTGCDSAYTQTNGGDSGSSEIENGENLENDSDFDINLGEDLVNEGEKHKKMR